MRFNADGPTTTMSVAALVVAIAVLGGCGLTSGLGPDAEQSRQSPVAAASDGRSPEPTEPETGSKYSGAEQVALDEVSAMSIEDVSGDVDPHNLDVSSIAEAYGDRYSPTIRFVAPLMYEGYDDTDIVTAFDVNAFVIDRLASSEVPGREKTELLKSLGLSPVALRDTMQACLKVANGDMDDHYPWAYAQSDEQLVETLRIWRGYAAAFYVASLSAVQEGATVPAASDVETLEGEHQAQVEDWIGDDSYTTNFGERVDASNGWIVRLADGQITHTSPAAEDPDFANPDTHSTFNDGDKVGVPSSLDIVRKYPFNPTEFLLENYAENYD